jgi:hypothetical protein
MLRSWAYVRRPGCSSRYEAPTRLGPTLHRRHALCEPCVSRTGISPSVCGRRTRAELHIQDIRPSMIPSSAAPRRRASCTHPCCSFPGSALGSALGAHGTLHSPGRGEHPCRLCRTSPEFRQMLTQEKGPPGRMGRTAALLCDPTQPPTAEFHPDHVGPKENEQAPVERV